MKLDLLALVRGLIPTIMLLLCLNLVAGQAARAGLREGIEAYKNNDFVTARQHWEPLAAEGDLNAIFNLAQLYRLGRGVDKDLAKAEALYLQAAEGGLVAAQGNLGTLYYFSVPDAPRVEPALRWWRRAAVQGDARSQYLLGVLYFNGSQLERDHARAYGWTLLAARSGLPEAIAAEKTMLEHLTLAEIEDGKALAQVLTQEAETTDGSAPDQPVEQALEDGSAELQDQLVPAPQPVAPAGGRVFYIQLSALNDEHEAERMAMRLREKFPDLLQREVLHVQNWSREGMAALYRLRVGPFRDFGSAGSRCDDFKARGQDCFVAMERQAQAGLESDTAAQ